MKEAEDVDAETVDPDLPDEDANAQPDDELSDDDSEHETDESEQSADDRSRGAGAVPVDQRGLIEYCAARDQQRPTQTPRIHIRPRR